tara:strand:+ start:154 stop:258 length:105 start_codon:yes stop_codon:yes gene_type:complete
MEAAGGEDDMMEHLAKGRREILGLEDHGDAAPET